MKRRGSILVNVFILNNSMLMYAYLFPCKIGTNVGVDILVSKKLLTLIESLVFMFPKDQQLYKHEVFLETILQVLKWIILNGMVCLSIFGGGVVTYVCLGSPIWGYWLRDFMFSEQISLNFDVFSSWLCFVTLKKINVRCLKSFWKISKEIGVKWWLQCTFTC